MRLRHTTNVIWDLDLKHLGSHIGYQPSVFFFGQHECNYWGDHNWRDIVDYINSKNNFMSLAAQLGIKTPYTQCFDSPIDIGVKELMKIKFPCYVKAAISVAGVGIYRCETALELFRSLANFQKETPVQIQEEVKADSFLNLQYRISGKEIIRLTASEQILDGFAHQGNRVPASHEPWESVDTMAYWLRDHGMKGIFAFDVAIVQTNMGLQFLAIECNPRFNGATYPTLIAQKLGVNEWSSITLSTDYRTLSEINLNGLEFSSLTGDGVVIVNWGTVLEGKLMFLVAGSQEKQQMYIEELKKRL